MTALLEGIDLVVFDKDGTLIEFGAMWSGWAVTLADGLEAAAGRSIRGPLFEMLGYDAEVGAIVPGGALAATPMARLRERTAAVLVAAGLSGGRGRTGPGSRLACARPGRAGPADRRPARPVRVAARCGPQDRRRDQRRSRSDGTDA